MIDLPEQELFQLGFKPKDISKCLAFTSVIAPILPKSRTIVDICSGNGLASFAFLYNRLAEQALMFDIRFPNKSRLTRELFNKYGFGYDFVQGSIEGDDFLELLPRSDVSIISVHPCSELGDRVIEIGLKTRTPFALMTCCHKTKPPQYRLQNPPDPRLMLYNEPADYFDLLRQRHIEEQGWQCHRKEISRRITDKNHILIGTP